jgi:hypothetical protein
MKILQRFGLEKTKPIESQSIISPQIYLAVEKQFEKTKPI